MDLGWAQALIVAIISLLALMVGACAIGVWLSERRYRRWFRINPMYRVGQDAKDRQ